jgi:hypothetical protein
LEKNSFLEKGQEKINPHSLNCPFDTKLEPMTPNEFQRKLMAVVLLRPDCDLNFVLRQVPITGTRDTWDEIAEQLFPV